MTAAIVATLLAAPPVGLAAWLIFRALTAPKSTARHRFTGADDQVRPTGRPATAPVVIPGHPDPDATGVVDVGDMAIPVPLVRQQAPLSADVAALTDALVAEIEADRAGALREDWARSRVTAAGEDWKTHMVKFDGTVLPRETALDEPTQYVARINQPPVPARVL